MREHDNDHDDELDPEHLGRPDSNRRARETVERALRLLKHKIKRQGFTQLEVQSRLGWGKTYLTQLFSHQKKLRLFHVLMILDTIGEEPREFFSELLTEVEAFTSPRREELSERLAKMLVHKGLLSNGDLDALLAA